VGIGWGRFSAFIAGFCVVEKATCDLVGDSLVLTAIFGRPPTFRSQDPFPAIAWKYFSGARPNSLDPSFRAVVYSN
jgi:hypothetical protein